MQTVENKHNWTGESVVMDIFKTCAYIIHEDETNEYITHRTLKMTRSDRVDGRVKITFWTPNAGKFNCYGGHVILDYNERESIYESMNRVASNPFVCAMREYYLTF